MQIDQRIPEMSDAELQNLHGNAVRLAASGAPAQKAEAARLLPIIGAALETRGELKRAAAVEQKAKRREAGAATRAKKAKAKVIEVEEADAEVDAD